MPSLCTWTGAGLDHSFDNSANWNGGVPQAGSDIDFIPQVTAVTEDGQPIYGNSISCDGMHAATGGAYNSVSLDSHYNATVTLSSDIETASFVLAGGTIDQPTGNTITANSTFTWTNGVLNSLANDTMVNILGGGTITLPTGGTLTCGSSLNFGSFSGQPVSTTIGGSGTLNFTAGSPITIDANSELIVATTAGTTAKFDGPPGSYDNGKAKIELKTNGSLTVSGAGIWQAGNRNFINNGGTFEIKSGATALFGALLGPPPGTPLKTDILQNSGTITIHSNCTLKSSWGAMGVNGGSLYAQANFAGGISTIDSKQMNVAGDTIIRVLTNIGTLRITGGDFYWTGGTFKPTVNLSGAGPWPADLIEVGSTDDKAWKLHVGGTATVEVEVLNIPPGGLPPTFQATVIKAWGGILGIGQLPPSLTLVNPQGVTFQLNLANFDQNGKKYDLIPG